MLFEGTVVLEYAVALVTHVTRNRTPLNVVKLVGKMLLQSMLINEVPIAIAAVKLAGVKRGA